MSDHDVVEFGLGCVAMAMRAKLGVLGRSEPMGMVSLAAELVPDDPEAGMAVAKFAKRCAYDQSGAGAALHDFIIDWRGGCVRCKAKQPQHYEWQDRADING